MSPVPNANRRNAGFSLVEIMVGLVIGLISMIIIMQLYALFEEQKRTTTSGSDALTNAGFSIFSIERDVRVAGYGFADATGCTVNTAQNTTLNNQVSAASFKLVPVTITQGMGTASDTISVLASDKNTWSIPARILGNSTKQTDTEFALNTPVGIAQGDLLVAYELGKNCTLFQVTAVDTSDNKITHTNNTWNKTAIFPKDGEGKSYLQSGDAMVYNLGSLMSRTYSIDANSNLNLADYSSATNTYTSQPLAPGIVSLQAQYGFDTRGGTQTDAKVDTWRDAMVDADGSGTSGDAGDIARIYAIRFVIVARSELKEKPDASGNCNATTSSALPPPSDKWPDGAARNIDLRLNPDGSANADWRCYRYKTFETVAPLRNMLWKQL